MQCYSANGGFLAAGGALYSHTQNSKTAVSDVPGERTHLKKECYAVNNASELTRLTVDGVAEDDRLVDLKLGEEGVEAVNFLALRHEGVELGNTLRVQIPSRSENGG